MLTIGALMLMVADRPAATAAATPSTTSVTEQVCPVQSIGFAPPLGEPLLLTRRIERALATGTFTQTITYRLTFERAARGYRMRWQQIDQHASGPAELLRLLSLQDDGAQGETLDFALDASGALLGVTEAPDAAQRLANAITRLRSDRAMSDRPQRERAMIGQMLDRMAALQPAERADMHLAKAARLLVLAGQECTGGTMTGSDGTGYAVGEAGGGVLRLFADSRQQRPDGSALMLEVAIAVSTRTGLIESHDRHTTSQIGSVSRTSRERLELLAEQAGTNEAGMPPIRDGSGDGESKR